MATTVSRTRRELVPILGIYVFLSLLYSLSAPLWEAPDEPSHYLYVRRFADGKRFIYPRIPGPRDVAWSRRGIWSLYQRSQPPLYHLLAAPFMKVIAVRRLPFGPHLRYPDVRPPPHHHGNLLQHERRSLLGVQPHEVRGHLLRLTGLIPGALTVAAIYFMARLLFSAACIPVAAAGFAATVPQFNFITGAINNDGLAALLAAFILLRLLTLQRKETRPAAKDFLAIGLLLLLGMATKVNLLFLFPVAWIVAALRARAARSPRMAITGIALSVLPTLLAAVTAMVLAAGSWSKRGELFWVRLTRLNTTRLSVAYLWERTGSLYRSFWADFGWMLIDVGTWMHILWGMLLAAALAGWIRPHQDKRLDAVSRMGAGLLVTALVLLLLATYKNCLAVGQAQGRYLFPAMGPIALLVSCGILRLSPPRFDRVVTGLFLAALIALNLIACFGYLIPASYP